jgi:peptide/nickel transport system permease protein
MTRYLLRQVLSGLMALLVFLTLFYFLEQLLVPYDFVSQFAQFLNAQEMEVVRHELGLDLPIWQRYFLWLGNVLQGDLGVSFSGMPIVDILGRVLPTTLLIFFSGTGIACLLGMWLGKITAWRGPGFLSGVTSFTAIAFYTSFPPWLAFLGVYFLVQRLGIFHNYISEQVLRFTMWNELGRQALEKRLLLMLVIGVLVVIVVNEVLWHQRRWRLPGIFYVVVPLAVAIGGSFAFGFGLETLELTRNIGLPILIFALLSFGEIMIIMQTSMKDTLHEQYIQTAHAKGVKDRRVRDEHAARNALLPVLSKLVISLPYLLTGLVIVEYAVKTEGMGTVMFRALINQDMPLVMGFILVIGLFSLAAQLFLDILHAYLDPRIRLGGNDTGRL